MPSISTRRFIRSKRATTKLESRTPDLKPRWPSQRSTPQWPHLNNPANCLRTREAHPVKVPASHPQIAVLILGRDGELSLHAGCGQLQAAARHLIRRGDGEARAGEGREDEDGKGAALDRIPSVEVHGRDHVHRRQPGIPRQLRRRGRVSAQIIDSAARSLRHIGSGEGTRVPATDHGAVGYDGRRLHLIVGPEVVEGEGLQRDRPARGRARERGPLVHHERVVHPQPHAIAADALRPLELESVGAVLRGRDKSDPADRIAVGGEAGAGEAGGEAGALPANQAERAPAGRRRRPRRHGDRDVGRGVVGRLHPAEDEELREDGVVAGVVLRVLDAVRAVGVVHHDCLLRAPLGAAAHPAVFGRPGARREDADAEHIAADSALVAVPVVCLRDAQMRQNAW